MEIKEYSKMKLFYDPSSIGKIFFPASVWKTHNDKILFTFDDGPNPKTTPKILDLLNYYGLKAVFFVVGENVMKYPEQLKQIVEAGHSLGNHTFNHKVITRLSEIEFNQQVEATNKIVEDVAGIQLNYFRPPKGRLSFLLSRKLKSFGLTNIMWNLLTYDYKNDLNIVKFALQKYLKRNSILIMHDNVKNLEIIEDSIRFAVKTAENKSLQFGEPSECLK